MPLTNSRGLRLGLAMLLLVAAPACTRAAAEMDSKPGVVFAAEGMRLTAYFKDGAVELVLSDGRTFLLPQGISASGARFTDGETLFWTKGDEAYFRLEGEEHRLRVVDPATDPWEKARMAGVVFRAVGQEPGWLLEIDAGGYIELLLDYGETRIRTPISAPRVDPKTRTTTYSTVAPFSPLALTVTVEERTCYDGMSGEGFTAAVEVRFGGSGATYTGCGRHLS